MTHYTQTPQRMSRLRPGDTVEMGTRLTATQRMVTATPCCGTRVVLSAEDRAAWTDQGWAAVRNCRGCGWPYLVAPSAATPLTQVTFTLRDPR